MKFIFFKFKKNLATTNFVGSEIQQLRNSFLFKKKSNTWKWVESIMFSMNQGIVVWLNAISLDFRQLTKEHA